jgi:L-alanine-DL-glutamate epimerase-like enolase superfamily enzyme
VVFRKVLVTGIDIYPLQLHYAHGTYVMSGGRAASVQDSTLVRVRTDEGVCGWGEACPLGATYLPDFALGVRAALPLLAEAVLGLDPRELATIAAAMDAALRGQHAAKSALDVACWDILGRSVGLPVCTLLGGRLSSDFPLYVAIPLGPPEAMAESALAAVQAGIAGIQLKLGGDPFDDVRRVHAVRAAVGDRILLVADANGGWGRHDALMVARMLSETGNTVLEQPCATLGECVEIRRRTSLPMSLDEVIVDAPSLIQASALGAMESINLKIGRVGGLSAARVVRDLAGALGIRATIEDTWGGDVVTAAVSHLAASTAPDLLVHASFMNDWVTEHIAGHEPRSQNGRGRAPDGPGLGIEVDVDALAPPLRTIEAR